MRQLAVVAILASALVAASVAIASRPTPPVMNLDPKSASAGPYAIAGGVLTRYRVWGDHGQPIVLLHGFVESTDAWVKVAPLLAKTHRVIAIDLRGFGYSARQGPYSAASMADQVQDLLRQLDVTRPILIGHSMGAGVLAELARRDTRSIRGMIFADGDGLKDGSIGGFGRIVAGPVATIALAVALTSDPIMRSILKSAYGPNHPPLTHALIERWRRPLRVKDTATSLAEQTQQGGIGLSRDELTKLPRVPTALIWGEFDSLPRTSGEFAAKALNAPLWTIKGAGHLTLLTHPHEFVALVERFESTLS